MHRHFIAVNLVINCEWKPFRQEPVMTEDFSVNTGCEFQGVDVRKKGIVKLIANALLLFVIKPFAAAKVGKAGGEDAQPHCSRNFLLATSQSWVCSSPSSSLCSVSLKAFSCQAGDSKSASDSLRSAQSISINFSFSVLGSCNTCCCTVIAYLHRNTIRAGLMQSTNPGRRSIIRAGVGAVEVVDAAGHFAFVELEVELGGVVLVADLIPQIDNRVEGDHQFLLGLGGV